MEYISVWRHSRTALNVSQTFHLIGILLTFQRHLLVRFLFGEEI